MAPSQQQIRNRTKGKRTKGQKRICIIKRKRTKLYLSWSVFSSDQSLQMWSDDYWFRSEEASRKKEWERRKARAETWERGREQEWEIETVIILGIWYFLFVVIYDCFVVNFFDRYILLNFGRREKWCYFWDNWFYLDQNFFLWYQCLNKIYQTFCSLVTRMCQFFFKFILNYFFFPTYPYLFEILGSLFHLGVLGNGLISLVEGPALGKCKINSL